MYIYIYISIAMSSSVEEKVKMILATVLEIEEERVEKAKRGVTVEWDSMAWVNIIAALEDEFDIELNDEEHELVSSFELICDLVRSKSC